MTPAVRWLRPGINGEGTIKYYIGNFGGNNYNLANSGNAAYDQPTTTATRLLFILTLGTIYRLLVTVTLL